MFLFFVIAAIGCAFMGLSDKIFKDINMRTIFTVISGIMFLILVIQSFNIENRVYDSNTATWVSDTMATNGYEYMLPLGFNLIGALIMLINLFDLIPIFWNRNFKNGDVPKGFESFSNINQK
jgi:hypothetical protein